MKWKIVLAAFLVVLLASAGQLEARGSGHFAGSGFVHFGASGFGYFGHHRFRGFAFGMHPYPRFSYGYYTHRFYNPCCPFGYYPPPFYGSSFYNSGFPFGDTIPFYGDTNDTAPDSGILAAPAYDGDSGSQAYAGKISASTVCRDSWREKHNSSSLSSVINSVFELQCENGHMSDTNSLQGDGQD